MCGGSSIDLVCMCGWMYVCVCVCFACVWMAGGVWSCGDDDDDDDDDDDA